MNRNPLAALTRRSDILNKYLTLSGHIFPEIWPLFIMRYAQVFVHLEIKAGALFGSSLTYWNNF